jgi:hypothetical protein
MNKKPSFPTPIQNLALNLAFSVLGERKTGENRNNRTQQEYADITARLPPLKTLADQVNHALRELHKCNGCMGIRLPQICRFKAGDERYEYEELPSQISDETVRAGLEVAGMRPRRWKRTKSF